MIFRGLAHNRILARFTTTKHSVLEIVLASGLVLAGVYLICIALFSLKWRMELDSPILMYLGYSMNTFGYRPYVDFLDVNMPGAYLINMAVGSLTGYGDIGFRIADLTYLSCILFVTWKFMKVFGKRIAWGGVLLYGMLYLSQGSEISFQREYLMILPTVVGVLLLFNSIARDSVLKLFLVGFMIGIPVCIKPQAAFALPVILLYLLYDRRSSPGFSLRGMMKTWMWICVGFTLPLVAVFFYLWQIGSLNAFIDMAAHWWPLNINIDNSLTVLDDRAFRRYQILTFGWVLAKNPLLYLAGAGVFIAARHLSKPLMQKIWLLVAMALGYSICTFIAGKFWPYQWLIVYFFLTQLVALLLICPRSNSPRWQNILSVAAFLVIIPVFVIFPTAQVSRRIQGTAIPIRNSRVDEIALFLRSNLSPGDTVQPLDWTGGALSAMLIARARLATPIIYDVIFYQDVESAYVNRWRSTFIADMCSAPPKYVIQIISHKPWISGVGTTRDFQELKSLLMNYYAVASVGDGYYIYQLKLQDLTYPPCE